MGCHTWCAKKVERSIEDARVIWIKERKKWIKTWKSYLSKKQRGESVEPFDDYTLDMFYHHLAVIERQLRMVEKGLCNVAVMNNQPEHSYFREDKGFFIVCDDFHDIFRVGYYPEDECFSLQETLDFIKKYETKYGYKIEHYTIEGHDKTTLEEFWEKYPDGYIHFG